MAGDACATVEFEKLTPALANQAIQPSYSDIAFSSDVFVSRNGNFRETLKLCFKDK